MLAIDLLLMGSQFAVIEFAQESGEGNYSQFFTYGTSYLSDFDTGGTYTLNQNVTDNLPGSSSGVEGGSSGNSFTDIFISFRNWLLDTTGAGYLINVVNAFPNFLKTIGLPIALSYAIGALWHATTFLLFIMFLRGNY